MALLIRFACNKFAYLGVGTSAIASTGFFFFFLLQKSALIFFLRTPAKL
jgi:hypothetical protein